MGEAEELFEGDIIKTKDLALAVAEMKIIEKEGLKAFDAINGGQWPNAVVPYAYSRYFSKFMLTVSLTVLTGYFFSFLFFCDVDWVEKEYIYRCRYQE